MKSYKKTIIFISLLGIVLLNANCSTLGLTSEDKETVSESGQWEQQTATEDNVVLSLVDSIFGSNETVEVQGMVQVGVKDGVPVYEFGPDKKDAEKSDDKTKEKTKKKIKRSKKINDKIVRKSIVKIEKENEYLTALEIIRLEKLGYDTDRGDHKKLRALKRKGKKGRLVFNKKKETYDAVVIGDPALDFDYVSKGFATKEELKSRQGSLDFTLEQNAGPKLYAPEYKVDSESTGLKGAVQLVWTKYPLQPTYEIEILRDKKLFSLKQKWNVMHIMVYWDVDYLWRARVLDNDGNPITAFAKWKPLKVVKPLATKQQLVKEAPQKKELKPLKIKKEVVKKIPVKSTKEDRDAASVLEDLQMDQGGK